MADSNLPQGHDDGTTDFDQPYAAWRYQEDLPEDALDEGPLVEGLKLFQEYSGIPRDQVKEHVKAVRDKAFKIHHYPCLGAWRFLHTTYFTSCPEYPGIIARLKAGDRFLDAGCCTAPILRRLTHDGAPSENLAGCDIHQEFIELGYEMYRDRDRFAAQFAVGNLLDDTALKELEGKFDVIHASSIFHLFGYDDQVKIAVRLVEFFKPDAVDAMILGRQVGMRKPLSADEWRDLASKSRAGEGSQRPGSYHHDLKSWQEMWDLVGEKTGTRWQVSGDEEDRLLGTVSRTYLQFVIRKIG